MGLGLSSGGDFTPFIKYNAKAGRWYIRGDNDQDVEVLAEKMIAHFDLDNIEIGWVKFNAEGGPETRMVPVAEGLPPSPGDGFKQGFRVTLYSDVNLGGAREWMANSGLAIQAVNELYEQYEKEVGSHRGECPVVRFTGATPTSSKHGTNYKPGFEIAQWAPRPAGLDTAPGEQAEAATNSTPPPPPANPVTQEGAPKF